MSNERGFENVELGVIGKKKKVPRRVIHFVSGETMEEYSTDEDEVDSLEKRDALPPVDPVGVRLMSLLSVGFVLADLLPLITEWKEPFAAAAAAKSLQSGPTRCDPIDGSPPGSPVLGILQARALEWVAISFSSA